MRNEHAHPMPMGAWLGKIASRTAPVRPARNVSLASGKAAALALAFSIVFADPGTSEGQMASLPDVGGPFAGDPRLEPIPDGPVHLVNFDVFPAGKVVTMRFPPRVTGQTQSR